MYMAKLLSALLIVSLILSMIAVIIPARADVDGRVQLFKLTRRKIPSNLPWYPLAVIGDNRPHDTNEVRLPNVFYRIINEIREVDPLAVIGTGDHVGKGTKPQIDELYNTMKGLENVWLVLGNHDIYIPGNITYWEALIGPEHYYIDDIPGWKIFFIDSEARLTTQWRNEVNWVFNNLGDNEAGIIVFHRPAYPYVEHNLDGERIKPLINAIEAHDHVKLVLQGHWHGFAVGAKYNVTWIITGGAGAPLYYYPSKPYEKGTVIVKGRYHYLYLVLYPNQTFTYYTVRADAASGKVEITGINNTAYRITNTKRDLFNKYTPIPVRINYTYKNWTIYAVILAPPNGEAVINFKTTSYGVIATCTADTWYIYAPRPNSDKAHVAEGVNHHAELILGSKPATTTPTTTGKASSTTTTPSTPTTSPPKTTPTTPAQQPSGGTGTGVLVAVAVVAIVLIGAGAYLLKKH